MKYIDADRLRAEIKKRKQVHFDDYFIKKSGNPADYGASNALAQLLSVIDSLQQEQPEVDLEKEVEEFCLEYDARKEVWFNMTPSDQKMLSTPTWSNFAANLARHFYELGLRRAAEMYDDINYNRQRIGED